jgi:hypothetical protein
VNDEHQPARDAGQGRRSVDRDDPFDGMCPVHWLMHDVGRYLAGDDAPTAEVGHAGRAAVARGASELDGLIRSAYTADEVIATELRFAGPDRGFRRTVFAQPPTPVALMLLCMRTCDPGDVVTVLQHTAGQGSPSRSASWPFPMDVAEQITRPPARETADLGEL